MDKFVKVANELADIAASISKNYFRENIKINIKEGQYPVTQVDLEIEDAIRAYLNINLPHHGVLGEEYDLKESDTEYLWVIDPIDGTASFSAGKPLFCTLIALLKNDVPILGLVDQAILNERWIATSGGDTFYNGKKCHTSVQEDLNFLRFSCTTPFMFDEEEKEVFEKVANYASIKTFGGDAYAYCLLASGHLEVILEADLKFYDVAALIPIIENAGGIITNWDGEAIDINSFSGKALACNNRLMYNEIIKIINY